MSYTQQKFASCKTCQKLQQNTMISITQTHFKKCSVTGKSNNNDCAVICNSEQEHNPRPTMYQACLHGCSSAFFSASDIGCHDNSIEEIDIYLTIKPGPQH